MDGAWKKHSLLSKIIILDRLTSVFFVAFSVKISIIYANAMQMHSMWIPNAMQMLSKVKEKKLKEKRIKENKLKEIAKRKNKHGRARN